MFVIYYFNVVYICVSREGIVLFKDRALCCNRGFCNVVDEYLRMRHAEQYGAYRYGLTVYIKVYVDNLIHVYIHRNILGFEKWFAHVYSNLCDYSVFDSQGRLHYAC